MRFKVQEMQYDIYAFICFYIICFYTFYDKFYYNSCVSTLSYIKYTLKISSLYHIYLDITVYRNACILQLTSFKFRNM